jgi:hypothetical protein
MQHVLVDFVVGVCNNNSSVQMANFLIHRKPAIVDRESPIKVTNIIITSIWIQGFGNIGAKLPFVTLYCWLWWFVCTVCLHGFGNIIASCPLPLSTIGSGGSFVPLASTANGAARPGIEVLHLTLGTSFGLANKGMCLFLGTGPVTREYTPMK